MDIIPRFQARAGLTLGQQWVLLLQEIVKVQGINDRHVLLHARLLTALAQQHGIKTSVFFKK